MVGGGEPRVDDTRLGTSGTSECDITLQHAASAHRAEHSRLSVVQSRRRRAAAAGVASEPLIFNHGGLQYMKCIRARARWQ